MAAKTYEIAFELAGKMSGNFAKTFKVAQKAVKGFQSDINDLNRASAQIDNVIKLRKETALSARAYLKAKQEAEKLAAALGKTGAPTKQMIADYQKAKAATDKARLALEKKRGALQKAETAAETNGQSLKELSRRNDELATAADKARRSQEKLASINERLQKANDTQSTLHGNAMSSAGSLAAIGAAATGTVGLPVKEAMAMEDAMAEVKKVVDFDDANSLAQLQADLEKMSTRIPMSADGLAQIAAAAGQSGIAAKDLTSFTEQAAKMAVAFDVTAEEAGTMMAKWQSGMGLTLDKTYKLADATNFLSNNNAAQAKQIGEVLQRYGALGKVAGLTETQTAAFAASVVASGAESEVAATGIKAFMRAMGKGGSMSEAQAAAFGNVGLDPKQLQKNLQKDAPDTIISTLEAIQKEIPKEQWNQYLSVMFGEEAAVAVGPMMQNLDGLKKNFNMVANEANYSGSMLKEFESRSATTSNALTLAKNAALYAARAIGAPLLEPMRTAAASFVETAMKVGKWIQENQSLVLSILKVAGTVTAMIAGFHVLRIALAFVISPLISLYKGFLNLKKAIDFAKNSTVLKTAATKLWTATCKLATLAAKAFKGAATLMGKALKGIAWAANKVLMLAWRGACIATTTAMKLMRGAMLLVNAAMRANPIGTVITLLGLLVAAGIAVYKNWDTIKAKVKELWDWVSNFFGKIGEKISNAWEKAKGFFTGKKSSVEVTSKVSGAMPHMASGGIATGPTVAMIGEGRESEAVLPLSKLDGMLSNRGGGSVSVNFSPMINITGGTNDAYAQVKRGLEEGSKNLKRELERVMANDRRLSYS